MSSIDSVISGESNVTSNSNSTIQTIQLLNNISSKLEQVRKERSDLESEQAYLVVKIKRHKLGNSNPLTPPNTLSPKSKTSSESNNNNLVDETSISLQFSLNNISHRIREICFRKKKLAQREQKLLQKEDLLLKMFLDSEPLTDKLKESDSKALIEMLDNLGICTPLDLVGPCFGIDENSSGLSRRNKSG